MDEEETLRLRRIFSEFRELVRELQNLSERVFAREYLENTLSDYSFAMKRYFLATGGPVTRFPIMRGRQYGMFLVDCECTSVVALLRRTPDLQLRFSFRITIKVMLPLSEQTRPLVIEKVITATLLMKIQYVDENEIQFYDSLRDLLEDLSYQPS